MMGLEVNYPSMGVIETLREWLAELQHLEATYGTPDTCEMLIDLQELLDNLDTMFLERVRKTSH